MVHDIYIYICGITDLLFIYIYRNHHRNNWYNSGLRTCSRPEVPFFSELGCLGFRALAEDKASRISVTCGCMGGISKSFASLSETEDSLMEIYQL